MTVYLPNRHRIRKLKKENRALRSELADLRTEMACAQVMAHRAAERNVVLQSVNDELRADLALHMAERSRRMGEWADYWYGEPRQDDTTPGIYRLPDITEVWCPAVRKWVPVSDHEVHGAHSLHTEHKFR